MRIIIVAAAALVYASAVRAQTSQVELGKAVYRSNCAFCHGLTALGGRGPNLASGEPRSEETIKKVVRNGVPGSTMPAFDSFDPDELNSLVAFLKSLSGSASTEQIAGDPAKGQQVYVKSGCTGCHQIGGAGSTYGPDLSRVGGGRPVAYLRESIVNPSADIPEEFQGVSVVTKDGKRITGVRANEDTFSVQLRLPSQLYRSFVKQEVKEVTDEKKSLMPAYKDMSKDDLENLLAYLHTLRGQNEKGTAKQAEAVR
jgi:putative heme-binding domain-containing protein